MALRHRQGAPWLREPVAAASVQIACVREEECAIHRAVYRLVVNREIVVYGTWTRERSEGSEEAPQEHHAGEGIGQSQAGEAHETLNNRPAPSADLDSRFLSVLPRRYF